MKRRTAQWTVKYPFTPEAKEYIRINAPSLEEFDRDELKHIVDYAYRKVKNLLYREPLDRWTWELEATSYPLEMAIIRATGNRFIQRAFAVAEGKRVYNHLKREDPREIVHIGRTAFNLDLSYSEGEKVFRLHLLDYIGIASTFSSTKWKLVNRFVKDGYVYLGQEMMARILAEHVKRYILERVEEPIRVPGIIKEYADKLSELHKKIRGEIEEIGEEILKADVEEFPPCIKEIDHSSTQGENLPHMARFALVTFLLKIGYSIDRIVQLFSAAADFDPEKTRYQVEHIAGLKGGRKRYETLACASLRTLGLCREEPSCRGIKHPLAYLRRVKRRKKREKTKH